MSKMSKIARRITFRSQEKFPSFIDIAGLPGTIGRFCSNARSSPSSISCNLFKDTFAFTAYNEAARVLSEIDEDYKCYRFVLILPV
jgi:hypothetical protein